MNNFRNILFLMVSMLVFACNPPVTPAEQALADAPASEKSAKWLPYNERIAQEEKAIYASQKVKVITSFASSASTDTPGEFRSEVKEYDRKGNLSLHVSYDPQQNVLRKTRNSYRNDLLVESVVDNPKGQSYRARYQYSKEGLRLLETLTTPEGDTILYRSYRYDSQGNETEARMINPKRRLNLVKTTTYDSLGRPIKVSENNDTTLNWSELYRYEGSDWTTTRTSGNGKVMSIYKTSFDSREHATSIQNLSPEGEVRLAIHYTYDAKGRLLSSESLTKEGKSAQRIEYSYTKNGLTIQQRVILPQAPLGKTSRMEYIFWGKEN